MMVVSSTPNKVPWIALGGALVSLWAIYSFQKLRRRAKDDLYYLRLCHKLRLALSKPRHSNFRVVAMLLLDNGTTIMGANDEGSPTISGAICAERGALMQYRILFGDVQYTPPRIAKVYVVSDHPSIRITPGCLCREYLYGHPAVDLENTRVILQCADPSSTPETWTLPQLYPFASPTARLPRQMAMETSQAYEQAVQALMSQQVPPFELPSKILKWSTVQQVYIAALAAARKFDTHDNVYPIRLAAAMSVLQPTGLSDKELPTPKHEITTAVQVPALEYGCTQDVVCQVLKQSGQDGHSIVFIVQVDQWGLPHAPFALARNAFCERSHQVTYFSLVGMPLTIVRGIDLYPTLPTIF